MLDAPTIVAVVSGKGGVGKSVVSVNLATTWACQGHRVALLDADVGQGSCALLMGEFGSVRVISAPKPLEDHQNSALEYLDAELAELQGVADFVILDAPAGLGNGVRWALDRADSALVVLVDEPTAIADSYGLCKLVWDHDPSYPLAGVVNMTDSAEEAVDILSRFSALTSHFLDRKILYAGWVPFSQKVRQSVRRQTPAVQLSESVSTAFEDLAGRVRCGVFETLVPLALN